MTAATVYIAESNTSAETVTNLTGTVDGRPASCNMGSIDQPAMLISTTTAIVADDNSFEKWQRFRVTDMGTATQIGGLRVWDSDTLAAEATHKTNARTTGYEGAQTFDAVNGPLATDRSATYDYTQTMPVGDPGATNLGIAGSLSSFLTGIGYSDYLVHQIQTTASAVAGKSIIINYQYFEYQ